MKFGKTPTWLSLFSYFVCDKDVKCLGYFNKIIFEGRKEGNVLFNDALNTFYLRSYGVRHMVKDHPDSERKPAAATLATLSD